MKEVLCWDEIGKVVSVGRKRESDPGNGGTVRRGACLRRRKRYSITVDIGGTAVDLEVDASKVATEEIGELINKGKVYVMIATKPLPKGGQG